MGGAGESHSNATVCVVSPTPGAFLTENSMARPKKNNAEYFTHDADMRNDVKVKALRRKFGHTGYAVWNYILETLTDSDFFQMDYSTVSRELLAADYDVSTEQLTDIVDYCMLIGLLQQTEDNLLYSEAHQRRFSTLLYNRERKRLNLAGINPSTQGNGEVMARRNIAETPENDSNGDVKRHSKVKDNKVKESKVKKSKEKQVSLYESIFDSWNAICGEVLPKVSTRSASRRAKIENRLRDFRVWGDDDVALAWAQALFTRVAQTPFLRGENKNLWRADFDWLFKNAENPDKVINGKYDDKPLRPSTEALYQGDITLGVGEFIDTQTGRRTYGTGRYTVPPAAPPRPSDKSQWSAESNSWITL